MSAEGGAISLRRLNSGRRRKEGISSSSSVFMFLRILVSCCSSSFCLPMPSLGMEAGGDKGDALPHCPSHGVVRHAEDDVGIGVNGRFNDLGGLVDLEEGQAAAADHVEEHALGAFDGDIEQGTGQGRFGGIDGAVLAGAFTDGHPGGAGILHDGLHIGEVQVNHAGDGNDLGDSLNAVPQDIVGQLEGAVDACLVVAEVSSRSFGIMMSVSTLSIRLPIPSSAICMRCVPSKAKGLVTTAMVSAPLCFGKLRDDRYRAGAGAAAHAGGHEDHVGSAYHFPELIAGLFGGFHTDMMVAAGAQAARQLRPELDTHRRFADCQRLGIGVHRDELDALDLFPDHAGDGVAAAAAADRKL